ncbi:flagellar protein export ATPase FliI [Hoeflea ulvae]|uniref:Flagellum-specific ATP synthase n=1 Tax=Hoeflea ulvae TaxID=2983764 RepID=A0ABT3YC97_9HYPH|nr:flagellar protein export ATPase FliI [Hoeflea ulvae]MCY0093508.1 flagellar protein export ATPase FliI [Hoeflea ulvae]
MLAQGVREFSRPDGGYDVSGTVTSVSPGRCVVAGLSRHVRIGDFLSFRRDGTLKLAEVISLGAEELIACPVDGSSQASIGERVWRKGAFRLSPDASWCGRTINSLGEPVDGLGPMLQGDTPRAVTGSPPASMTRQRVDKPLRTGVRVIDVFTPICQGQRLGVFAGSGVGKSTLLSMFAKAADFDRAVVALVGERGREVREFIEDTLGPNMAKTVAVVATSDESPMLRKLAPLTAMAIAEHFRDSGENVLLIVDSLTRFAHALREIGMAAGEPPVARGYPASVFTALPGLLERAGPGPEGAGAITAIVSILVDGDNHNDPVADSARGILDGHLVLDRALADEGRYPPVNPLTSISRLARKAWRGDEEKLVMRLKALIHRYEETRDLRLIGGYRAGSDAELDMAIKQAPVIYETLRQTPEQPASLDAFAELADAMKAAAGIPATPPGKERTRP